MREIAIEKRRYQRLPRTGSAVKLAGDQIDSSPRVKTVRKLIASIWTILGDALNTNSKIIDRFIIGFGYYLK